MSFDKPFEHDQALFNAAVDEFVALGYEQASINTILKRAGMSKGQFYYHFGNKEGLYLALIAQMIAQKRAFMAQTLPADAWQGDLFTILRAQLRHGIAFARAHPVIDRFGAAFIKERGNAIYARALARFNFNEDAALRQLVMLAAQRGELRDDLPLPFVQKLVGHLLTHSAEIADLTGPADAEAEIDHLIAFMQAGLARSNDCAGRRETQQ